MPDAPSTSWRTDTDFIRESVNGLWGRPRDIVIRGCDNFCTARSAILFGSKRCELNRIRVEIHQESLKPPMTSAKCWGDC